MNCQREEIYRRISRTKCIIPSLHTFLEDTIYLEPCSKVLRTLIPKAFKGSIYEYFRDRFFGDESDVVQVEIHEATFSQRTLPSKELAFWCAYRILWLFSFRHFRSVANVEPRKSPGFTGSLPTALTRGECENLLAKLALQVGFRSPEMIAIANRNLAADAAYRTINSVRPFSQFQDQPANLPVTMAALQDYIARGLFRNQSSNQPPLSADIISAWNVKYRCGRIFDFAFVETRKRLFLHFVYGQQLIYPRFNVTSFAIFRDTFMAFFGRIDGEMGPHSEEPPTDQDLGHQQDVGASDTGLASEANPHMDSDDIPMESTGIFSEEPTTQPSDHTRARVPRDADLEDNPDIQMTDEAQIQTFDTQPTPTHEREAPRAEAELVLARETPLDFVERPMTLDFVGDIRPNPLAIAPPETTIDTLTVPDTNAWQHEIEATNRVALDGHTAFEQSDTTMDLIVRPRTLDFVVDTGSTPFISIPAETAPDAQQSESVVNPLENMTMDLMVRPRTLDFVSDTTPNPSPDPLPISSSVLSTSNSEEPSAAGGSQLIEPHRQASQAPALAPENGDDMRSSDFGLQDEPAPDDDVPAQARRLLRKNNLPDRDRADTSIPKTSGARKRRDDGDDGEGSDARGYRRLESLKFEESSAAIKRNLPKAVFIGDNIAEAMLAKIHLRDRSGLDLYPYYLIEQREGMTSRVWAFRRRIDDESEAQSQVQDILRTASSQGGRFYSVDHRGTRNWIDATGVWEELRKGEPIFYQAGNLAFTTNWVPNSGDGESIRRNFQLPLYNFVTGCWELSADPPTSENHREEL